MAENGWGRGSGTAQKNPLGEWKERITIQKSTLGNDSAGNHVLSWEDYYTCSAYVNNLERVLGSGAGKRTEGHLFYYPVLF